MMNDIIIFLLIFHLYLKEIINLMTSNDINIISHKIILLKI